MNIAELKVLLELEYREEFNYDTWENDDKPYFDVCLKNSKNPHHLQFVFYERYTGMFWCKGIIKPDGKTYKNARHGFSEPTKDINVLAKDLESMRGEAEAIYAQKRSVK